MAVVAIVAVLPVTRHAFRFVATGFSPKLFKSINLFFSGYQSESIRIDFALLDPDPNLQGSECSARHALSFIIHYIHSEMYILFGPACLVNSFIT